MGNLIVFLKIVMTQEVKFVHPFKVYMLKYTPKALVAIVPWRSGYVPDQASPVKPSWHNYE